MKFEFIKFVVRWIGSNLAVPFWVVGHVHLTLNVYDDIYEILMSCGMNIIVMIALWMEWTDNKKKK